MGRFLEQFNDPGLEIDLGWDPEKYAEQTKERLVAQAAMALHAHAVPRRLGGDATRDELAADKKISRQVQQRTETALKNWGGQPADVTEFAQTDEERHRKGAQVDWPTWYLQYKATMQRELRIVATSALRTGHLKVGNQYVNRLFNELGTMDQILGTHA